MRRYTPGTFRTDTLGFNARDLATSFLSGGPPSTALTEWSAGATLIDTLDLSGPTQGQDWTLLSLSIEAQISFELYTTANGVEVFGRLSRILAGVILDAGAPTQGAAGVPYQTPMQNLPPDATLISTLWDPEDDAMAPTNNTGGAPPLTLTVNTSIIPSGGPIDITGAIQGYVGIWMEPSLLGITYPAAAGVTAVQGLCVTGAEYTVNYDDGN